MYVYQYYVKKISKIDQVEDQVQCFQSSKSFRYLVEIQITPLSPRTEYVRWMPLLM